MRWTLFLVGLAWAWGFWGHRRINRLAVFALPESLFAFYRPHIEYITRQSTKPDERRGLYPEEPPRHYIDLDNYPNPAALPRDWEAAVAQLSLDTLRAHGMLPWHLEKSFYELVEAFRQKDAPRILKLSAEIGHYLGDAHVPLHTTANYNGQLTGQHGVHALWESYVPERYGDGYDYWVGQATLWLSPRDTFWSIIMQSHSFVEKVLSAEREATQRVGEERKFVYRQRGRNIFRTHSDDFLRVYHTLLEGMVESRLRAAVRNLASLWYTAWHLAGRPVLIDVPFSGEGLPEDKLPDTLIVIDPRCNESACHFQNHAEETEHAWIGGFEAERKSKDAPNLPRAKGVIEQVKIWAILPEGTERRRRRG
ncbi:MAG: zinc dependent phospholipase C family protein [Bacteroidia bacterium]|nr:zinc dependent phospholipase C family protein [Bacteroidia bacterium]MDW8235814.1 zinc dependent phospholipase C family protein [Bacteroidia bacterium]